MLYATGVRVGELVSIKVSDIHFGDRMILILGKGNKERMVPYGDYCEEILTMYLKDGYVSLNQKIALICFKSFGWQVNRTWCTLFVRANYFSYKYSETYFTTYDSS